jgi:hypothetical protein
VDRGRPGRAALGRRHPRLAGASSNWNDRRPVNLAQLRSFRIGDPWLSAGLLKVGDPIYLVKWEVVRNGRRCCTSSYRRRADLRHHRTNYGDFVLDQASWEQRFGIGVSSLTKGELASSCAATATPATVTPIRSTLKVREGG